MARTMMTRTLMSVVATMMLFELALGADHNVGAPGGWDTSTDLGSWASSETFTVDDNLVFTYTPNHDVVEVNKAGYDSCSISNAVSTNAVSPTTIKLSDAGTRYFICGTPGHCGQGMKVEIKTVAATTSGPPSATTPPSSGSPAPPASTTSPPSSAGTPTPPASTPAKPSSATIVKATVVSMMGIGLLMMI
ncbi:hypothetical protein R6Q59_005236 [Mikania micrantha]|uniref:Phytocyanin domain-containing protein n=1 Tax=Mikania micrantha TaxID=192012 RepID=A0A5N6Q4V6_9ASTR|nr:hypothetical protein E3N88_02117 [Mikania micrantha]